jgi:hypothetical protein
VGATVTPTPNNMTITSVAVSSQATTFTVAGGTSGARYRLDVAFTTNPLKDVVPLFLRVKQPVGSRLVPVTAAVPFGIVKTS